MYDDPFDPCTLAGVRVRLEPLDASHLPALAAAPSACSPATASSARPMRAIERHAPPARGSGYLRDSVYSSILATEWPELRAALVARMVARG